jgi:competence protein ComEC
LLTGDIGSAVESRLIKNGLGEYNYLFAPHHGSKSSSSRAFLIAVNAEAALISTAYHNQFNFPHSDVLERFAEHDTVLWNTAECGAIRIILQADAAPYVQSARRHESALWRWPPEADCP